MSSTAPFPAIHHWISGSAGTYPALQTDKPQFVDVTALSCTWTVAGEQIIVVFIHTKMYHGGFIHSKRKKD
jgi:hypothetical protein